MLTTFHTWALNNGAFLRRKKYPPRFTSRPFLCCVKSFLIGVTYPTAARFKTAAMQWKMLKALGIVSLWEPWNRCPFPGFADHYNWRSQRSGYFLRTWLMQLYKCYPSGFAQAMKPLINKIIIVKISDSYKKLPTSVTKWYAGCISKTDFNKPSPI